jgi:2-keto-3-deoxy-L-rhamnonate aldolase RhmA
MELSLRRVLGGALMASLAFDASVAGSQGFAQGRAGIVGLLAGGQAVFGIFSGPHTPAQGALMARTVDPDFVFYSLESGPFDVPGMRAYGEAMRQASVERSPPPLVLRIPPIRDGADAARDRQGLAAGVAAIVFPHVESARDAALAVEFMGPELRPGNPDGQRVAMLIIEDTVGIARAREIVSTPGVGVVFAGPGDLRRAYHGDMAAVERAIQTVLAACKEFAVPCGITAGVDDVATRLAQGFRVVIVSQAEALSAGRRAAGR